MPAGEAACSGMCWPVCAHLCLGIVWGLGTGREAKDPHNCTLEGWNSTVLERLELGCGGSWQAEEESGEPALAGWPRGPQNRLRAFPGLQVHRTPAPGGGQVMSGPVQHPQRSQGPSPTPSRGTERAPGEGSGARRVLPGPTPPGNIQQKIRKHKESTHPCIPAHTPHTPHTPNNNRVLWDPPDVHSEYPYFLIYLEVYGIVLHTVEGRDHCPQFIYGDTEARENMRIWRR